MPDTPPRAPEFGLYVPVMPQEVPQLYEIAQLATDRVSTYLRAEHKPRTVEPRQEFGITVMSQATIARYLGFKAASFNVSEFVAEVDQLVRPMEVEGTSFPVEKSAQAVTMNRAPRQSVLVEFDERSSAMQALMEQQEMIRGILWRHTRVMVPRGIESASINLMRLNLMSVHPGRLNASQRNKVKRLTRESVAERGLRHVALGRMVIGTNYNTPIAGAAWPTSART